MNFVISIFQIKRSVVIQFIKELNNETLIPQAKTLPDVGSTFSYREPSSWWRGAGCRGGSRYVEGCWGFPLLENKKVSWCFGFLVSKIYQTILCFQEDIDLISKMLKISLNESSSLLGARLSKMSTFFDFQKLTCANNIFWIWNVPGSVLVLFRYPGVSKDRK